MSRLESDRARALGALALAVALHLAGMASIEGYGSTFALRSILVLSALLAVASVGQTLVVILGGIDLSIPFLIGFGNVVAAQLTGQGVPFALVLPLILGLALLVGMVSGALSAGLTIHPLIVTLGVGTMIQGAILLWTGGLPSGATPAWLSEFVSIGGTAMGLPVPWLVPATGLLLAIVSVLLGRTTFGRRLYAVGINPAAARLALIRPLVIWSVTFGLSAVFAALAGVLLLGFTGSAWAEVGQPYLFQTIAAVVIGGTPMTGGRGGYLGTVAGALVLSELGTLLIGFGLQPPVVQATLGAVIVALVSLYAREPHVRRRI